MEPTNQIEKEKEKETSDGIKLKLSTIDDVTLEFMVNTAQYEKYLRKNNIEFDSGFKRDLRFYRKRIISLTKDLFKSKNENGDQNGNIDVTMVGAFNMYMRACISYLKFSDQSETIQKCYVCLGIPNENDDIKKCICKNNSDKNNDNNDNELNQANALCFKPKDVKKVTLDSYVIRKNVKKAEPIVYPQQFTFNPKDPSFKYKGLKSKPSSIQAPQIIQTQATQIIQTQATQVKEEDQMNSNVNTSRENGEKDEIIREKIKGKKDKIKKNKKVSFDITNYVNNI
jgi:hypothetical protein